MERRKFLVGGGVVAAGIAGCLATLRGGNSTFQNVEQNGNTLDIEFAEESDIKEVTLIHDGQEYGSDRLATGEYRAAITISKQDYSGISMIPPGEYKLVATDRDDERHEHELELASEIEITDVEIPEGEGSQDLHITVENSGTGPGALHAFMIEGDRLHESYDSDDFGSGIQDFDRDEHETEILLNADRSRIIGPSQSIFVFDLTGGTDESIESPEDLERELGEETIPIQIKLATGYGGDYGGIVHTVDVDVKFSGNVETERYGREGYFEKVEVVDFEYSAETAE